MSLPNSPWQRPEPARFSPRLRTGIWVALLAAVGLGLYFLSRAFPGQHLSDFDTVFLLQGIVFAALIARGLLLRRQLGAGETFVYVGIWAGIAFALMLGYTFHDELGEAWSRLRGELVPSYGVATDAHTLVLTADESGQFTVYGRVDGMRVKFLVDTGASDIVLSPDDAKRLGVDLSTLDYSRDYETANGGGRGAPFTVASLSIGAIRLEDVPISINQAPMSISLLGMPFFRRLQSFEIRGRRLYLTARSTG